jgi:hypothetical protein
MARTNIVAQTPPGAYPATPIGAGDADIGYTSTSDPTDRSTALVDTKTFVVVYNSDDTLAHTITITGALDSLNRRGDITAYSVDALENAMFGPFKTIGWATGGLLLIDVSDPKLQVAIITLP